MARAREYQYQRINRQRDAQDDWYLQRRKEMMGFNDSEEELDDLEISEPTDPDEMEADFMASQITEGINLDLEELFSSGSLVQPKMQEGSSGSGNEISAFTSNTSGGYPLDIFTRDKMESKMGVDLGDVRIHTDQHAQTSSKQINAKAYTQGQDIYFSQGTYNPNSAEGSNLLVHELVHTQQQKTGVQRKVQRKTGGPVQLIQDDTTEAEKITWLQKKLKAIWVPLISIPLRYFITRKKALKAYSYLCQISIDNRKDFFKKYPDAITMILQSLPAGVYEAANFGFVPGIDDDNERVIADLEKKETWDNPSYAYVLLLILAQRGDAAFHKEKRTKDNLPELSYTGKLKELISAHKDELLKKLDDVAFWSGPVNDITSAVAILVMGGYKQEAQHIVSNRSSIEPGLKYQLDDLLGPDNQINVKKKNTLWNLAVSYVRSRKKAKKEFRNKLEADIQNIKDQGLSRKDEKTRIAEVKKDAGKFKDHYTSLLGAVGHFAIGSKKEAHLNNLDILELQKGLGGELMDFGIIFSNEQKEGKKYGYINYNADIRKGDISVTSDGLPFSSINYAAPDYTFRTESGLFGGVDIHYKWPGLGEKRAKEKPDDMAAGTIDVKLDDLTFNNIRILFSDPLSDKIEDAGKRHDYTYALGKVQVKGLRLNIEQSFGPRELMENATEVLGRTSYILMDTMQLLMYAIQRSINRFIPTISSGAGESLKKLMMDEFSDNLFAHIQYDTLEIFDFYSTEHGAIESITTGLTLVDIASNDDAGMLAKKYELNKLLALPKRKLKKNKHHEQERIAELKRELSDYYANKMFSLDFSTSDLEITNKSLFQTTMSSQPSQGPGVSYEVGELGPVKAKDFSFSTNFTSQRLSQTSVWLKDISIDVIDLKRLRIAGEHFEFGGTNSILVKKLLGDLIIHFKDEQSDADEKKRQGLIERVEIPKLSIAEISAGGFEYSNYETFKHLVFPPGELVKLKGITVLNVAFQSELNVDKNVYELVPDVIDKQLPSSIDIGTNLPDGEKGIEIPANISYQSSDVQGRVLLGLITGNISGRSLHVDQFEDGTQIFDFTQLTGDVSVNGSDKKDPLTTYASHITLDSDHLRGKKKDNVITLFNLDIPSVQFDKVSYKTSDTLFRTKDNGRVVLAGIKSTGDVVLTLTTAPAEKDPRPFQKLEIPELHVSLITADSLELYFSANKGESLPADPNTENSTYFIVEPGKGGANVFGLNLKPFNVINELVPQTQDQIDKGEKPSYRSFLEGEINFGTPDKKDAPAVQLGGMTFGTWNKDATKIIQGSLHHLNIGNGTIGFSTIEAADSKYKNKKLQKTSFTVEDIRGKGKYAQTTTASDRSVTSIDTEFDLGINKVKGSYDGESLVISELKIPKVEFSTLGYSSPDLSFYLNGDGVHKIAITGTTARDIRVDFNKKENASKIKIGHLKIPKIQTDGELRLNTGFAAGEVYKEFTFPAGKPTTIENVELIDWIMVKGRDDENQLTWLLQQGSKANVGPINVPEGFSLQMDMELRLKMNNIHSDKITFESLGRDGFKYSIFNLDASGIYNSKMFAEEEILAQFGINTTELSGEVLNGFDKEEGRRFVEYKLNKIDIPQIYSEQFHFKDTKKNLTIDTGSGLFSKSFMRNITGDFSLKMYQLTPEEKKNDKINGTTTKTKKVIKCTTLNASQITLYGLSISYNEVVMEEDNFTLKSDMLYEMKLPARTAATLRNMELKDFVVTIPALEDEHTTISGTATAGKDYKGNHSLAVDIPSANLFVKNNMTNFFVKTSSSVLVDTITFDGKGTGFDIDIENTSLQWTPWPSKLQFPLNLLGPYGLDFGLPDKPGKKGEVKGTIYDQFFHAKKIGISKKEDGSMVYSLTNPTLPYIHLDYNNSTYILGGAVNGTVIMHSTKADFGKGYEEDGFLIETKDEVELTDITIKLGKSIQKEENGDGETKKAPGPIKFSFMDHVNGTAKMDLQGGVPQTLEITDGNLNINELKEDLGIVLENAIKKNLEWGPNAIEFFEWIDWYSTAGWVAFQVPGWVDNLFEGLEDEPEASRDFFAQFVKDDVVGNLTIFKDADGLVKLHTDNIIGEDDPMTIAAGGYSENPYLLGLRSDPTIKISKILEYFINKPEEPKKDDPVLEDWNPDNFATLEDLFGELVNNEFFGTNYLWGAGRLPDGAKIKAALAAWIPSRLAAWIMKALTFDIKLHDFDLSRIPGFKFTEKDTWWNPNDVFIHAYKTGPSKINLDSIHIPAFSYTYTDPETALVTLFSTGGITADKTIFDLASTRFKIKNESVKLKGLKVISQSKIQKKSLSIGSVNDPMESEADNIAAQVANGQNADLSGVSRFMQGVQRKEKEEEAPLDLLQGIDNASGGTGMDDNTRTEMESRMGVDFSSVKIYTGNDADHYNRQVSARAFTYGQNIFFGNGNYNPSTRAGKELLAHELVHTVQQGAGSNKQISRKKIISPPGADPIADGSMETELDIVVDGDADQVKELALTFKRNANEQADQCLLTFYSFNADEEKLPILLTIPGVDWSTFSVKQVQRTNGNAPTILELHDQPFDASHQPLPQSRIIRIYPPKKQTSQGSYVITHDQTIESISFHESTFINTMNVMEVMENKDEEIHPPPAFPHIDFRAGVYRDRFRLMVEKNDKLQEDAPAGTYYYKLFVTGLNDNSSGFAFSTFQNFALKKPIEEVEFKVIDSGISFISFDADGDGVADVTLYTSLIKSFSNFSASEDRKIEFQVYGPSFSPDGDQIVFNKILGRFAFKNGTSLDSYYNRTAVKALPALETVPVFTSIEDELGALHAQMEIAYQLAGPINAVDATNLALWQQLSQKMFQLINVVSSAPDSPDRDLFIAETAALATRFYQAFKAEVASVPDSNAIETVNVLGTTATDNKYTKESTISGEAARTESEILLDYHITNKEWSFVQADFYSLSAGYNLWIADRISAKDSSKQGLSEQIRSASGQLDAIAELHGNADNTNITRVRAVYFALHGLGENMSNTLPIQLPLYYYYDKKEHEWVIVDLIRTQNPFEVRQSMDDSYVPGPTDEPPIELFQEFNHDEHLPDGIIYFQLQSGKNESVKIDEGSDIDLTEILGYAALVTAAAGLVIMSGGTAAPAVAACFYLSAGLTIASAVLDTYDAMEHGQLTNTRLMLNMLDIATSLLQFKLTQLGKIAMMEKITGVGLTAAQKGIYFNLQVATTAMGGTQLGIIGYDSWTQIEAINAGPGTDDAKKRAVATLLSKFIITGSFWVLDLRGTAASADFGPNASTLPEINVTEGTNRLNGKKFRLALPPDLDINNSASMRITECLNFAGLNQTQMMGLTGDPILHLQAADLHMQNGNMNLAIAKFDEFQKSAAALNITPEQFEKIESGFATLHGTTNPKIYRTRTATFNEYIGGQWSATDKNKKAGNYGSKSQPLYYGTTYRLLADEFHLSVDVSNKEGRDLIINHLYTHGLPARGTDTNLSHHVRDQGDSAFRGTTTLFISPGEHEFGAARWAGDEGDGLVVEISDVPGWDMNETLGDVNPYRGEQEIAILASVPNTKILGVRNVKSGFRKGNLIQNENYK